MIKISCSQHKKGSYIYKMVYVWLMVTMKQTPVVDSEKIKLRKSEHIATENHHSIKVGSKIGKREKLNYKTTRNHQLIKWQ